MLAREIHLEDLDDVSGGERAYGWSGTVSLGIVSFGVTRMDNGNWYLSGGGALGIPSLRFGASIDRVSVTSNEGKSIDDALTGLSAGGGGHVGIGGSAFMNDSGRVVSIGIGAEVGVGATWTSNVASEASRDKAASDRPEDPSFTGEPMPDPAPVDAAVEVDPNDSW